MEIVPTIHSCFSNLQFPNSSLHFRSVLMNLSSQFSQSLTTNKPIFRFQKPLLPTSIHSQPLIKFTSSSLFPKYFTTNCSVADGTGFDSATKVVVVDPFLAVKKKAMDISPELKGTSIFLVGMKSSIKHTLGKILADALRYYYFDSDSLVEEAVGGKSALESFKESDEKGFHESETEVLKQLSSIGRLVVCAGDGAVQSSTNLATLRHGISIWIDVPLDIVARATIEDYSELPTLEISTRESFSEVLTQLSARYEEMRGGYATADATVSLQKVACQLGYDDLDAVTTDDMAMEVLKEIEKLTGVKKMMEAAATPF